LTLSFSIYLINGANYEASHYAALSNLLSFNIFCANILLSTLFSNTCNLCSSLNVRDQLLHSFRTKRKIVVLNILIFMFLDRREHKTSWTEC
jgi:hypothetical protein